MKGQFNLEMPRKMIVNAVFFIMMLIFVVILLIMMKENGLLNFMGG
ncbi:MAG: hypothetical protein GXO64_01055 [Candidatus Micrarchaeota archaeon]|nr:hypothetical protein [Candidatus Micrarchaeota archaeon]